MKDQQIDAFVLYKAYYRFLQEAPPRHRRGPLRNESPPHKYPAFRKHDRA